MAQITLKPNESFEHTHSKKSYTKLLKGKGILKMENKVFSLRPGAKIEIPANVSHIVINESAEDLSVICVHGL
jgi:mannose-6-phosphate isomerase-like protein (cupin superfamily)